MELWVVSAQRKWTSNVGVSLKKEQKKSVVCSREGQGSVVFFW